MKKLNLLFVLGFVMVVLPFSQCKKKKVEPQLPPETTVGAMTFGCKINGRVFLPKDARGHVGLFVQYVNLGTGPRGGWYLNIPAIDWKPASPESVNVGTDSLLVVEGARYPFKKKKKGFASAFYAKRLEYNTTDDSGELFIKKFDKVNRIISGTFSFTATDLSSGETVTVSDGRFDIQY